MAEDDESSFSFEDIVDDFVEDYDDGPCDGDLDYECLFDEENISAKKKIKRIHQNYM